MRALIDAGLGAAVCWWPSSVTTMAYFALFFIGLDLIGQLDWSPHLWLGSIVLAAGIGLFVGWLVNPNQATPRAEDAA